MAAFSDKTILL